MKFTCIFSVLSSLISYTQLPPNDRILLPYIYLCLELGGSDNTWLDTIRILDNQALVFFFFFCIEFCHTLE